MKESNFWFALSVNALKMEPVDGRYGYTILTLRPQDAENPGGEPSKLSAETLRVARRVAYTVWEMTSGVGFQP